LIASDTPEKGRYANGMMNGSIYIREGAIDRLRKAAVTFA
jgi:hypothetical protein